jgi:predicted Zn-dependent protease
MNTVDRRVFLRLGVATAATVGLVACGGSSSGGGLSSSDLGSLVQTGVTIGTGDAAKGEQFGNATSALAGATSDVSPEQEFLLGEGVSVKLYSSVGPRVADEQLQRYVNLVARTVAQQSSRPDLQFSVAVLETDTVNAFAAPGGFLFVTSGTLKKLKTEAELAAIMGHEIAHVTERHMIKTFKRARLLEAANATLQAVNAAEHSKNIDLGNDLLLNRGLDQNFEYEADAVGLQLAALSGYDPQPYRNFLNVLANDPTLKGGFLQTHPSATSRLNRLQALYAGDLSGVTGQTLAERYQQQVLAKLT